MEILPLPPHNNRLGFHYFPDTLHYRENDLQVWLPELRALGATWLTLMASPERAIPEPFLRSIIGAGIEPILHFPISLANLPSAHEDKTLFDTYGKWGVHYAIFFDRPNSRSAWSVATWAQEDLVERFLDRFLPLAEQALQAGITPVFPPLEPGGNYWDTAFLQTALQSIQRRKLNRLLDNMVLAAYAWNGERSLNWGAGGPERWPGARAYFTPPNEEDQRGFRIFEWYQAISQAVLHKPLPMILLGGGTAWDPTSAPKAPINPVSHVQTNLTISRLMIGEMVKDPVRTESLLEPVRKEILCCNFWLLAAGVDSPYLPQAWFQPEGKTLPVVGAMHQWVAERESALSQLPQSRQLDKTHPISHYLLLPMYEWGVADWHLDVIRPFVKKYQPTVGFSLEEASLAARVTMIGNTQTFSDEAVELLCKAGCEVERICGDGISIATQLAER
jgi:hypothetical protein